MPRNYLETMNWEYISTIYDDKNDEVVKEYINEERTMLKQVWKDGYIEYVII